MPGPALNSLIRRLETITSLSDGEKNGILNLPAKLTHLRQVGYNAPFTPLEAAVTDLVTHHLAHSDPYL